MIELKRIEPPPTGEWRPTMNVCIIYGRVTTVYMSSGQAVIVYMSLVILQLYVEVLVIQQLLSYYYCM